jgi:endo-1,4-beta-xylanase
MVTNFFDKHLRGNQHQRDDLSGIAVPPDSWADPFADDLPGTQYKLYDTPTHGPNTQASYRIYLPPGYNLPENAQRRYPVIYDLHGVNDDSRKPINSGYIARADVAIRTGIMPPTIIIAVQALNQAGYMDAPDGKSPVESVIIKDLIPHIDKTYRTIATREARAVEGHSMGGSGALHLGFKYPELFGTVAGIAPAVAPTVGLNGQQNAAANGPAANSNPDRPVNAIGGTSARNEAEGARALAQKNADKIRGRTYIRLIVGDKDFAMLSGTKAMSELLTKLNIAHEYSEAQGAPHFIKEVLSRLDTNPFEFYGKAFAQYK